MSDKFEVSPELQSVIETVKKSGLAVHKVTIAGHVFVYRSLNRSEWKQFQKDLISAAEAGGSSKEDGEDELILKCLLYPKLSSKKDLLVFPAGVATSLSDMVLKASGFSAEEAPVKL